MFEKEEIQKIAEEYYYKTYPVTLNIGEEERKEEVTDIFIKGAELAYNKANEWHKVADGDIPENERWVCNQDGCYCYYDIDTEQWLDTEGTRTRTIEWCDMPTKESE